MKRISPTAPAEKTPIAFAIGKSDLGNVLVARSAAGVCAILIGAGADGLKHELAISFRGRALMLNGADLRNDLSKVIRFIESPGEGLHLTLDIRGTPFQASRVESSSRDPRWNHGGLRHQRYCPGHPLPPRRAQQRALSGYRWDVERKRALIEKEALA